METTEKGDFIQSRGLAFYGFVIGEGYACKVPAYKVSTGGGRTSAILKSHAVLVCKKEADDENQAHTSPKGTR